MSPAPAKAAAIPARVKIVTGVLALTFAGYGFLLATRTRTPHQGPPPPTPTASVSASASAPVASASAPKPQASASAAPSAIVVPIASASSGPVGPEKLFDRPLGVIALGWDLAAPSIVANGGVDVATSSTSEFTAAGIEVRIAATQSLDRVEAALARGGADKDGADIAVLPMCQLVAAYERLRVLSPEVFFITGYAHGSEAVVSSKDALPAADKEVKIAGTAGDPASFLTLFALDLHGVPGDKIRFVAATTGADEAPFAAIDRDVLVQDPARHNVLITSADASRLIPYVAVAQRSLVEKNEKALAAWAKVELSGFKKLTADPPTGARKIATAQGAPDALALVKRLGQITPATLSDNARAVGLTGKTSLTLEALFRKTWPIWRGAGVLATPAPDQAPIAKNVITALVKASSDASEPASTPVKAGNLDSAKPMIVVRQDKLDEADIVASIGLAADAFERSPLRLIVAGKNGAVDASATKKLIAIVEERLGIGTGRVVAGTKALAGKSAVTVEIFPAP
jgi:hypothetical protein